MFKNSSIKKVIVLCGLIVSPGQGMEPERVYSPINPVPENRPVFIIADLNAVRGQLDFDIDIQMDFPDESSEDFSYAPSHESLDESSDAYSMDEDGVVVENNLTQDSFLGLINAAAEGQNEGVLENYQAGFAGNLLNYLNAGNHQEIGFDEYVNNFIPIEQNFVIDYDYSDSESASEEAAYPGTNQSAAAA